MNKHSSIVGGSTAGRLLNCPGSYQATLALPPSSDISSSFAEEGTFAHAVMDRLMQNRKLGGFALKQAEPDYWIGQLIGDRVLTKAHVDEMIMPALKALDELEAKYGGNFEVAGIEVKVEFPGIPGGFGTCDLVLQNTRYLLLVDWKFGQGVPVKAIYSDEGGEFVNAQLLYYATGLRNSARHLFKNKRALAVAIVQPRTDEPLTDVVISHKELKWFAEDMRNAVVTALDRDPPLKKGEWCRFAPCKINCPLWTGPMLELAALNLVPRTEMVSKEVTPYAEYLARAKAFVDLFAMYKKEVDEQLHAYLEDGGKVPGWKLKAKVKQRQWIDEVEVAAELQKLGFAPDEIWQYKLQTFATADAAARRKGVKIPDHLRVAPPSTETTVCPESDPAPAVERGLVIEQFQASLKQLKKAAK
jgi:hypothetical protein